MINRVASVEAVVREQMAGQAAGHGIDHVIRVLRIAEKTKIPKAAICRPFS